jgi:hypothetical protein
MKKGKKTQKERRKYLRIPFWADIYYRVAAPPKEGMKEVSITLPKHTPMSDESPKTYGRSRNISAGGILFDAPQELPKGTLLTMGISMAPGTPPVNLRGQVVRVEKLNGIASYQIAVSFLTSDKVETHKIARFVERFYC